MERPTAVELLRRIQKLEECEAYLTRQIISKSNPLQEEEEEEEEEEYKCMNILESMGRTVYMFDANNRIVYWNRMAQTLYGYTPAEALGKTAPEIIIAPKYSDLATLIIQRALHGQTWSGQFPVRTKFGDKFAVITTLAPCYDHNGTAFAVTCVCADPRHFPPDQPTQPQPAGIVSKISTLATKVKLKMKTNLDPDPDSNDGLHKVLSLKAEAWMRKTRISCPWLHHPQQQTTSTAPSQTQKEASESSSSHSSSTTNSWSINSHLANDTAIHFENMDVEISWDALTIGDQIGQGSHGSGTVYHALLYGSDVAVKIFTKEDYPDDVILSFRKEVCLMKRLRHPNILLFMGAVISPPHLCIVTEYLPRGSLFTLLRQITKKLDWRRRLHMAMDIAQGMNYLHNCQPPIIHRDLKSSNLLVDKNWTLKVGDFGLSRIKHGTYLTTKAVTGTPHWMAPEVLRNEQVDEKSDVYSYGVILWEITTGKIPWDNLNSMQVIAAVGFMNQRLEIPDDVHPQWASLIESCWSSDPRSRPTFGEILMKLKDLQKKLSREVTGAKKDDENA